MSITRLNPCTDKETFTVSTAYGATGVRRGNVVTVQVYSGSVSVPMQGTAIGSVPASCRPSSTVATIIVSHASAMQLIVAASGAVSIWNEAGAQSSAYLRGCITYVV